MAALIEAELDRQGQEQQRAQDRRRATRASDVERAVQAARAAGGPHSAGGGALGLLEAARAKIQASLGCSADGSPDSLSSADLTLPEHAPPRGRARRLGMLWGLAGGPGLSAVSEGSSGRPGAAPVEPLRRPSAAAAGPPAAPHPAGGGDAPADSAAAGPSLGAARALLGEAVLPRSAAPHAERDRRILLMQAALFLLALANRAPASGPAGAPSAAPAGLRPALACLAAAALALALLLLLTAARLARGWASRRRRGVAGGAAAAGAVPAARSHSLCACQGSSQQRATLAHPPN
ncbi:hypothetical protein MNEG_5345 [Monoraphidium neglectum]|uniref:Uncharacterized protein n=1 Tax=Monoraphidium neglectum TaxID=145388 RepID=A0A0D2L6W6_9CHLO|nr:hypothetical protein MNEG_5345 [Monoraphidium neglectum]KIZ02619.1 hypothetical protein MNEG_5345 [Monoraphidium neglectum]|eukprot:XP_013901638.1 hypothetical protein MNEG_5345 [Monoraphidium neglectum]